MKRKMLNRLIVWFAILTVFLMSAAMPASAQPRAGRQTSPDIFTFLPASDGIVSINVHRLLNETLPLVFVGDSAKLAQINSELDKFKMQTGVDARTFDRVVLSARYTYPTSNVMKMETVAIAQGAFDAKALLFGARLAGKEKIREEKYHGQTMLVLAVNNQIKMLGLWNMKVNELAVCALNNNTLALGSPANVRAAIDAARLRRRANGALSALATRDPEAVIGFGGDIPQTLLMNLNVGSDAMAQDVKSIRQVYGSIGTSKTDVSLDLLARTDTVNAAKNLSDTVQGLKQLAAVFIFQMPLAKRTLAQGALDNLKIVTRGNELEIKTQFAAASLASLIK